MAKRLRPIETIYKGYRFRSRLEARWAIFFDGMGVKWRYEPEGFELDGERYLPDFYLPEQRLWLEIKPEKPTTEEIRLARLLKASVTNDVQVGVLYGEPGIVPDPNFNLAILDTDYCLLLFAGPNDPDDANCLFSECRRCGRFLFYETIASHCKDSLFEDGCIRYGCCDRQGLTRTDRLEAAYKKARQARFEHGEAGF